MSVYDTFDQGARSADDARAAILDLVTARGAGKTICPSEAARRVDPENWRRHMTLIRRVAAELADEGRIQVFRKGKPVDIRTVKGVIRLGLPRDGAVAEDAD